MGSKEVSIGVRNKLFLQEGLDTPNQLEFAEQINIYVKSNSRPAGSTSIAIAARDLPVSGKSVEPRDTELPCWSGNFSDDG